MDWSTAVLAAGLLLPFVVATWTGFKAWGVLLPTLVVAFGAFGLTDRLIVQAKTALFDAGLSITDTHKTPPKPL